MEENSSKRIRLVFRDDDILTETQKSDGLNRSWVLLKPYQNDTVSDVASHLLHAFQLHQSCPHGLLLSISGFVLPPFESTSILKDDEVIRVRKRRDVLSITGNNATNEVEKLRDAEKQPENTGVLLLANDEFEKEKGGYESDEPEEDVEGPKKRKRKAEEKIEGSKKKKRRSEAAGTVEDNAPTEKLEDSLHAGEHSKKKKKKRSRKEIKDGSDAKDRVEENEKTDKLNDENDTNVEVQENGKETGDVAPKETKKGPSRSARRKYAKRRWLREMAKIQKQNETCESEGLRNWKEDQAKKAGRKNVDGQLKVQQKWKKQQVDAEINEVDDQPKGLLHVKISPQNNRFVKGKRHQERNKRDHFLTRLTYVHELRKRNGNEHEHPTQNVDGVEQPNEKQGDVQEQPGQKSDVVKELPKQNFDAPKQLNEESDEEGEIVPVVIRPGHIRFEPLGKEQAVQQNDVPSENFQWNGITSKKKGQQWGKENRSFTPRNEYKLPSKEYSQISSLEKPKQTDKVTDFDKLPPLPSIPKEGDVIAYRLLELSSSWTPELSAHRVGKVFSYNPESNQTTLVPVPEYPIVAKISDEDVEEDEDVQPDNSLYKEDGSLEIDFSLLIDVRIINNGDSGEVNKSVSLASEGSVPNEIAPKAFLPSGSDKQTVVPSPETGGASIWDEVSEALNAKKEQLLKENGWGITPKKVQPSQDNSWGSNAKKVQPPSPENNSWGKNVRKVQPPSQDNNNNNNNREKQSSGGGRSWSYKGLRGGGLASTMAMIRSKKDVWG